MPTRTSPAKQLLRVRCPKVIARLVVNIDKDERTGCWDWQGYTDRKGYGQINVAGKAHWAHRISYAAFEGEIPEGMTVNHRCARPGCINPEHLELMSNAENAAERWKRDDSTN